jgi:glycosyltransferase involved in cell wall biosynthesis
MTFSRPRFFREEVEQGLKQYTAQGENTLKVDLHCHDLNSNKPSERLGRILGVSETWLPTAELEEILTKNRTDVITVTNHNNARSCWDLLEQGKDVLTGAEFTCRIPAYGAEVHVLTYGFTPEQEAKLKKLRKNLLRFLEYTREEDLVTVLAHPLYFKNTGRKDLHEMFDLFAVVFERFEGINGQRDSWQNLLVCEWIDSLTPEVIDAKSRALGLAPADFCRDPYRKELTGGSDDHMGMFAGNTGTYIEVDRLRERLAGEKASDLALEGLREGGLSPYGRYNEDEKMASALLEFFCQCFIHMKDPGLLRMMLHKGKHRDKLGGFAIANAIFELRRHKVTSHFLMTIHNAFHGRKMNFWQKLAVKPKWRPLVQEINHIADVRNRDPERLEEELSRSVYKLYHTLMGILVARTRDSLTLLTADNDLSKRLDLNSLLHKMEVPSYFRHWTRENQNGNGGDMSHPNIGKIFDGLSFPVLASSVLTGTYFASAYVMNEKREFLNEFAARIGRYEHPKRVLWLTDTFGDTNGVSMSLRNYHREFQRQNLPVDFLVCHDSLESEDNLIVLPPVAEFQLPFYKHQTFRVPSLLAIQKVFSAGGYDRVMCSTEAFQGIVALYLKAAFNVPAYFFLHTDWIEFGEKTMKFDKASMARLKRVLRGFYRSFDKLFVLNQDHKDWLTGRKMMIAERRIHTTKHWVAEHYVRTDVAKSSLFPGVSDNDTVLLFTGRVSEEKGVHEFPRVYRAVREKVPNVKFVICGRGPAREKLQRDFPEGIFIEWVEQEDLPRYYSAADVFVFPSTFDTFGRVVLEAISCGLPVCAYNMKGPKDIIIDGECGMLADSRDDLIRHTVEVAADNGLRSRLREGALKRAADFRKEKIVHSVLDHIGLFTPGHPGGGADDPVKRSGSQFFKELLNVVNA